MNKNNTIIIAAMILVLLSASAAARTGIQTAIIYDGAEIIATVKNLDEQKSIQVEAIVLIPGVPTKNLVFSLEPGKMNESRFTPRGTGVTMMQIIYFPDGNKDIYQMMSVTNSVDTPPKKAPGFEAISLLPLLALLLWRRRKQLFRML